MDSVMEAHQDRVKNSLAVESLECIVYRRSKIGLPQLHNDREADNDMDAISAAGKEDTRQQRSDDVIEFGRRNVRRRELVRARDRYDSTVEIEVGALSSMHEHSGYEEHAMGGKPSQLPYLLPRRLHTIIPISRLLAVRADREACCQVAWLHRGTDTTSNVEED